LYKGGCEIDFNVDFNVPYPNHVEVEVVSLMWDAKQDVNVSGNSSITLSALHHSEYLTAICPLTESTIKKTIYSNAGSNLEWTELVKRQNFNKSRLNQDGQCGEYMHKIAVKLKLIGKTTRNISIKLLFWRICDITFSWNSHIVLWKRALLFKWLIYFYTRHVTFYDASTFKIMFSFIPYFIILYTKSSFVFVIAMT